MVNSDCDGGHSPRQLPGSEARIDLEAGLRLSLPYFRQAVTGKSLGSDGLTAQFRLPWATQQQQRKMSSPQRAKSARMVHPPGLYGDLRRIPFRAVTRRGGGSLQGSSKLS